MILAYVTVEAVEQHRPNRNSVIFLLQPAPPYVNDYTSAAMDVDLTGSPTGNCKSPGLHGQYHRVAKEERGEEAINPSPSRVQGRNSRSRTARELLSLRRYTPYVWFSSTYEMFDRAKRCKHCVPHCVPQEGVRKRVKDPTLHKESVSTGGVHEYCLHEAVGEASQTATQCRQQNSKEAKKI